MPNHVHGIIVLGASDGSLHQSSGSVRPSLWETVRTFKAATSTIVRKRIEPAFGWQRGYYDRVIRSEAELERAREYIRSNPEMWVHDTLNPTKHSPTLDGRSL